MSDENAKWFLSGCIFAFFLLIAFVINNYKNNWEIRRANREAALVRQMSVKVWRSRNLSLRSTPGKIPRTDFIHLSSTFQKIPNFHSPYPPVKLTVYAQNLVRSAFGRINRPRMAVLIDRGPIPFDGNECYKAG